MATSQKLTQNQEQRQLQKLSQQQMQVLQLVECSVAELEQRVKNEIEENVALEEGRESDGMDDADAQIDGAEDMGGDDDYNDAEYSSDESQEIYDYGSPDDIPSYLQNRRDNEGAEIPIGDTGSFIEDLELQISDFNVTDRQRDLLEYLIGSLNERGFVDRSLQNISDDLLFNNYIEVSTQELQDALDILQQFDPPGIGARNIQECLLIQIKRKLDNADGMSEEERNLLLLEQEVVTNHFKNLENNNLGRIRDALGISENKLSKVKAGIAKLNICPGMALGESASSAAQTAIPDFIIETTPDEDISLSLNKGNIPTLHVSADYVQQMEMYKQGARMSKDQKEAFNFTRKKVEAARTLIDSIKQRQQTLYKTMKSIIQIQRKFVLSQDKEDIVPMTLQDVERASGVDFTTVSRVKKNKYVAIDGKLYSLEVFFLHTRNNAKGEAVIKTVINSLLGEIIESEDKRHPYTDDQLADQLAKKGQNISRRTVAKYREELGIPPAKMRSTL